MKFILITSSIILFIASMGNLFLNQKNKEIYMVATELNVNARQGEIPITTHSIPHAQETQNSSEEMMDALVDYMFSLPNLRKVSSRNSFPSAVGAYINENIPINGAVDREFIHIHRETGLGSMHAMFPDDAVETILSNNWGIVHPMSRNWSNKKILMIYAPRDEQDLTEIKKIVKYAYEYALAEV